ncbi:hypothetical protein TW95_gp1754 [Pandoravirus inopinatum]|uniref:Transmembrane protein n=1 Tax=Pandoravirus inopinatum TaxID=1605721 RepID=A0A0B5IZU7_9VIRU|nr:hypothetical protein TW95_gp1754 [Pandoravirus inopinatum]AJF98488.1 hypothetical protein [Pandoravirus inopinatum]
MARCRLSLLMSSKKERHKERGAKASDTDCFPFCSCLLFRRPCSLSLARWCRRSPSVCPLSAKKKRRRQSGAYAARFGPCFFPSLFCFVFVFAWFFMPTCYRPRATTTKTLFFDLSLNRWRWWRQ